MSTTIIQVNDKEEIKRYVIDNIQIRVINLSLGKFVDVAVTTRQGDVYVNTVAFHIEGEDYNKWGNDDTYLENYILEKLGLTKKE